MLCALGAGEVVTRRTAAGFQRVVFDLLLAGMKAGKRPSSMPPRAGA